MLYHCVNCFPTIFKIFGYVFKKCSFRYIILSVHVLLSLQLNAHAQSDPYNKLSRESILLDYMDLETFM